MALYMIGAGLDTIKDISIKALEALKKSDKIYFEYYTSKYNSTKEEIEDFIGKEVIFCERKFIEENDDYIKEASEKDISIIIIGDVFAATTHIEIYQRAKKMGVQVEVMHNASILTAVGITGLELYKFGKTTSIPFPEENYFPTTAYEVITDNLKLGLHTLVLLDLKDGKYMRIKEALEILKKSEEIKKNKIIDDNTMVVGCARLGSKNFDIKYGKLKEIMEYDFGEPLHCLIIPGKLHFIEEEMLNGR